MARQAECRTGVRRAVCVGTFLGIVALGSACDPSSQPGADAAGKQPPQPQTQTSIPECPHEWTVDSGTVLLAGSNTNVPEYHDCQKLITAKGYGPLVAVFARKNLDLFGDSVLAFANNGQPERGLAAAEIWNVDDRTYAPLNITPGFSCLYMYNAPKWKAKLVNYGTPQPNCLFPIDVPAATGLDLEVDVFAPTSTGYEADDVPPVARWEWDPKARQQYIGVKCEKKRWCEVGLPGFTSSSKYDGPAAWPIAEKARREIKGWYDEQVLAIPAGGGTLAPGGPKATVIPVPKLGTYDIPTYTAHWVPVATVALHGASTAYTDKFNFVVPNTPPTADATTDSTLVSLCRGSKTSCTGIPDGLTCKATVGDTEPWWARIDAPGKAPVFKCVVYRPNSDGSASPGTARWRWAIKDETIWVSCPHGCCEVFGDT